MRKIHASAWAFVTASAVFGVEGTAQAWTACSWSTTNFSATKTFSQVPTTTCMYGSTTYTGGPAGGINPEGGSGSPSNLPIAPHFTSGGDLRFHAIGKNGPYSSCAEGGNRQAIYFDGGSGTCNGWRTLPENNQSSTTCGANGNGITVDESSNVAVVQSSSGNNVLWNPAGTSWWANLTLGTTLLGTAPSWWTGTPSCNGGACQLNAANATGSVAYGVGDVPLAFVSTVSTGCSFGNTCTFAYDFGAPPTLPVFPGASNGYPNPGGLQITVDRLASSDNVYQLGNDDEVYQWVPEPPPQYSWARIGPVTCSGGVHISPQIVAVKNENLYALAPNSSGKLVVFVLPAPGYGITCFEELPTTIGTQQINFDSIVTDNSDSGPMVWATGSANSAEMIYACF